MKNERTDKNSGVPGSPRNIQRLRWTTLALAALVGGTAGCGPGLLSRPGSDFATTTTSSAPARFGAPLVAHPIDARPFLTQPCASLTPAQLTNLSIPGPGVSDIDSHTTVYSGPSCSWRNSETLVSVAISFITGNKNGLADIYRGRAQGQFPGYWVETTVDGYPGVFAGLVDGRQVGICELSVGITDPLTILVVRQDRTGEKSCDQAKVAASMTLKTIKAG